MITINGAILEKVDTGANWAANNPVLPNKMQGFDSTVRAFKIGDGVTAWNDLPYYYSNGSITTLVVDIPAGSPIPLTVTDIGDFANGGTGVNIDLILTDSMGVELPRTRKIFDVVIETEYTDNTFTTISYFDIYGHEDPDNLGSTIDHVTVTFYK